MKKLRIIQPTSEPVILNGPVTYSESTRGKSVIKLKKTILEHFSDIKGNNNVVKYQIELYKDLDSFEGRTKNLVKEGKVIPMLLFLLKED